MQALFDAGIRRVAYALAAAILWTGAPAKAQQTGSILGRVVASEALAPLGGVYVAVDRGGQGTVSDERGAYRLTGIPAGDVVLVARYLGRRVGRLEVRVPAGGVVQADFELAVEAVPVGELVVSAAREAQRQAETPASIGVLSGEVLRDARPSHASEVLNRVPGVWVSVTGGEGHMTAIRHPKTTNPVYLFAEDGVPTRSTGFFNHNALYEVDLPQAERVEVIKGPASALYGSDAIGGVINVVTRAPGSGSGTAATLEGGAWGFGRVLASIDYLGQNAGVRAELNVTRTDGWRDGTAYDRQTGTLRWDRGLAGGSLRTVFAFSRIDQGTAGSSAISRDDYLSTPELNYTPISFRRVAALRLHSTYEKLAGDALFSVTPYVRWNHMEMLPNWTLTFDPGIWETGHRSAGALLKYRRDFARLRARLIAGADIDYSPGEHFEQAIVPRRDGRIFSDYEDGPAVYDYDVRFFGVSPYLQAEAAPVERLRLVAGLRFDHIGYDYDNRLGELVTGTHRRPASTSVSYDALSPKLGATLSVTRGLDLYAAYGRGFRAPSEGQLFRQGRALSTVDLEPVVATNVEAGARGALAGRMQYQVTAYRMVKHDDILSLTHADGSTETVNAGETLHRGIEVGLGAALGRGFRLDGSYSRSTHRYEEWQPRAGLDYGGNQIEDAPRDLASLIGSWSPALLGGGALSLEWQHVGRYWMDPANTHSYGGHDLLNLRAGVHVRDGFVVFGRLMNLADTRYAEGAAFTIARGEEFAPGLPRAFYIGVELR